MARSDRLKVRRQVKFAANHLDGAMECLQQVDIIADGRSKKIVETLPKIVALLDGLQKILNQFRREL